MAPMAIHEPRSIKRTSSQAQFDMPVAKKINVTSNEHHKLKESSGGSARRASVFQRTEDAETLLTRSINLALQAIGFSSAHKAAVDKLRSHAEEYMYRFLSTVHQSMVSSRRLQTIPEDFLQALHVNQLSLRALLPHLDPPVSQSNSRLLFERDRPDSNAEQDYKPVASLFVEASHQHSYIPKHFPPLPDRHTYQATPDFPVRESNPRVLREKAREEGQLGEQALRKLVAATEAVPPKRHETKKGFDVEKKKSLSLSEQRHQMWMETITAVTKTRQSDSGHIGDMMEVDGDVGDGASNRGGPISSGVNSEKRFWRKPVRQRRP